MSASSLRQPDEWVAFAQALLDEVQQSYARYGADCAPTLTLVTEGGPIPCYNIDAGCIEINFPSPSGGLGRLKWLYYQNLFGADDLADVQAVFEANLPMVMAHEVAHHLRFHYEVVAESLWREEQIVQLMAMALVAEHPFFAPTLEQVERYTRRTVRRLAEIAQKRRASTPKTLQAGYGTLGHRLLVQGWITPEKLAEAEAFAALTNSALDEILLDEGLVTAAQLESLSEATTLAEDTFNQNYMADITDYWLSGTTWMLPHLERRDWPSLGKLIERFIRTEDWESRHQAEARLALERALHHRRVGIAAAAAIGLVELQGEGARALLEAEQPRARPAVRKAIRRALTLLDTPTDSFPALEPTPARPVAALQADLERLAARRGWATALADTPLADALLADHALQLRLLLREVGRQGEESDMDRARPLLRHESALVARQAEDLVIAAAPEALREAVRRALRGPEPCPSPEGAHEGCRAEGGWLAALADLVPSKEPAMLTKAEKLLYLRAVPALAAVSPEQLWPLTDKAVLLKVAAGETIYQEGDPSDMLYVVTQGEVALWTQGDAPEPILVQRAGEGDAFGALEILDRGPRAFTARALASSWLLALERADLLALGLQEPEMLLGLIDGLVKRIRALDRQLEQRAGGAQ